MQLNNSGCDSQIALDVLLYQNDWAKSKTGDVLDGLIGAECSAGRSGRLLIEKIDWVDSANYSLNNLSTALCPPFLFASISTAGYGSSLTLPQISFKSSTTELSEKNLYPYFGRTCANDAAQGPALSSLLIQIGITPYIAMVSTTDGYATSMSAAFAER
jgi:hypothetical protein